MNKASGGDGIPVELFQILKDDAVKVLHSNASKFGKLSSGHRTGKGQFYSNPKEGQCQRIFKLPYNCSHFTCKQGYAQNPSSQALAIHEPRTSRYASRTQKRQRNQRSNCQHSLQHQKSKRVPEKHPTTALLTMPKPLTIWISTYSGKQERRVKKLT